MHDKSRVYCLQSCTRLEPVRGLLIERGAQRCVTVTVKPTAIQSSATIAHMTSLPIILSPENASKIACIGCFAVSSFL